MLKPFWSLKEYKKYFLNAKFSFFCDTKSNHFLEHIRDTDEKYTQSLI